MTPSRSGAKITFSIRASMAGSLMPIRLREPGVSAALEPQYSRCSLPGESDSPQPVVVMSKSKLRMRFWYCA